MKKRWICLVLLTLIFNGCENLDQKSEDLSGTEITELVEENQGTTNQSVKEVAPTESKLVSTEEVTVPTEQVTVSTEQAPTPTELAPTKEVAEQAIGKGDITATTEPMDDSTYPDSFMIEQENQIDYQTWMECSAFASAYVLRHYGEEADGMELYEDYPGKLDNGGVLPYGVVSFFKDRDYDAEFIQNGTIDELKEQVSAGVPVIVFIHVKYPYTTAQNTHYVPCIGYDEEYLYFAESVQYLANCIGVKEVPYNRKIKISDFELLWENINEYFESPYFVITKKEQETN